MLQEPFIVSPSLPRPTVRVRGYRDSSSSSSSSSCAAAGSTRLCCPPGRPGVLSAKRDLSSSRKRMRSVRACSIMNSSLSYVSLGWFSSAA
jgi:hypothetical protein